MKAQDYTVRHFELMRSIAIKISKIPIQVIEHYYNFDAFGSWHTVTRFKGKLMKIIFDGKEGQILIRLEGKENIDKSKEIIFNPKTNNESEIKLIDEIIDAIKSLSSAV